MYRDIDPRWSRAASGLTSPRRPRRRPTTRDAARPTSRATCSRATSTCRAGRRASACVVAVASYDLRGSEVRTLATVGAFRVVPVDDLRDADGPAGALATGRRAPPRAGPRPHHAVRRRARAHDARDARPSAAATSSRASRRADATSAARRSTPASPSRASWRTTSRVHRAYRDAAERLSAAGGRVRRVVLEHELKREYQRFLQAPNRGRRDSDGRPQRDADEIARWARGAPAADRRRPRAVPGRAHRVRAAGRPPRRRGRRGHDAALPRRARRRRRRAPGSRRYRRRRCRG